MWLATNLVRAHQGSARPRASSFPTSPPRLQKHVVHIAIKIYDGFERYGGVHQEVIDCSLPWILLWSRNVCAFLQLSADITLLSLFEYARCSDS